MHEGINIFSYMQIVSKYHIHESLRTKKKYFIRSIICIGLKTSNILLSNLVPQINKLVHVFLILFRVFSLLVHTKRNNEIIVGKFIERTFFLLV